MGLTWPNIEGKRVTVPGYYWNEKLSKLARLQVGEKLPRRPGKWEFIAHETDASSSEIARRLFDRYPKLDINDFTFTTRSPLGRRLPLGERPSKVMQLFKILGLVGAGFLFARAIHD